MNRFLGLSESRLWKLFAGAGIGAFFGLVATLRTKSTTHWAVWIGSFGAMGVLAVLLLFGIDAHRRRTGSDHVSPLTAVFLGLGFFALVILVIFIAFLIMTR